ncbi:ACP S-malonyltransferase [Candidatus Sneabacter namystus]|uniref:Malonyl CoA-acyl carrier protein transacylase n=1 Tax=Candidatus Sneabacter namystus TaxID=2601646 RepID=A0A5C0UHR1_9RICK|nr:ACP S-malonyltransferase [Candidatus Sneabacter namystus]QEK39715.1 ACP S-malonyltransferase [Candidatus Sneabacter namystus]
MSFFVFPGQGSQHVGMGKCLFGNFSEVRLIFEQAEDILQTNIKKILFEGNDQQLKDTTIAQPAIFIVSASALAALQIIAEKKFKNLATIIAGHSLGQYTALFAAGALNFEDTLSLIKIRAQLMSQAPTGAMAACLNIPKESVNAAIQDIQKNDILSIANYNSNTQLIVSGTISAINQIQSKLKDEKGKVIVLNVSGAFHSKLMQPVVEKLNQVVQQYQFSSPVVTVISNTTAQPLYQNLIAQELVVHLTMPVLWSKSVEYAKSYNTGQSKNYFVEIGPKNVLSNLAKRDEKDFEFFNLETTKSIKAFISSMC